MWRTHVGHTKLTHAVEKLKSKAVAAWQNADDSLAEPDGSKSRGNVHAAGPP